MLSVGGKGAVDQDVTEISFQPMNAQGLVVQYVHSGWVFSQNAKIRQEDFLNFLVTGMEFEHRGTFRDGSKLCCHHHQNRSYADGGID